MHRPLIPSGDLLKVRIEKRISESCKFEMANLRTVISNLCREQQTVTLVAFESACYTNLVFFLWGPCGNLALTDNGFDSKGVKIDVTHLFNAQKAFVESGIVPEGTTRSSHARPVPITESGRYEEVLLSFELVKRNMFKNLEAGRAVE